MNAPGNCRGRLTVGGRLYLSLILFLSAACAAAAQPLPTRLLPAPSPTPRPPPAVVVTWPPTAALLPTPLPSPVATPTPTPPPAPTATDGPSATPCATPGRMVTGAFPSRYAGPQRPYRLYLPPCYQQDGRLYPTLYMLHGSATGDGHWDSLGLDEAAGEAIARGDIPPFLIVLPNGGPIANVTSGGPYSFEAVLVEELLPFVEATHCAWPERAGRAIGGLSRGGYWALEIAFRHPALFGAVGGHSAALLDTYAGPDLDPQYTAFGRDLGGLRIYLDAGSADYVLPPLLRLHENMVAAGLEHTWTLNDGRHEDSYWAAHLGAYLRWYAQSWPADRAVYPPCPLTSPLPR